MIAAGTKVLVASAAALAAGYAAIGGLRPPPPGGNPAPATAAELRQPGIEVLQTPSGEYGSQPNISADATGNVYLVWSERPPGAAAVLRLARLDAAGRWAPTRTITSGAGIVASAADLPSVLVHRGGRLVAHWQQVSPGNSRSYGVRLSQSTDGGATWSAPVTPHVSHETGENGFVTLFPLAGDSSAAMWIDGRSTRVQRGGAGGGAALMLAAVAFDGGVGQEKVIDTRVCDCCHTAYALARRGPVVVYRDRSVAEIRDISIVRFVDGAWTAPRVVHDDQWHINACPVNGPSVAAADDHLAVAWFTAARDTSRLLLAVSDDGGASFARPVRLDGGDPLGRTSVVMAASGDAWVSWLERVSNYSSELRLRKVARSGELSPHVVVSAPGLTYTTGFPRMTHARGVLYLTWTASTAPGAPTRVQVARVRIGLR